jgi:hypothetical protein
VRDLPGVGLGFADQGRQALAQICGGSLVKAVVDLAGIDQVAALVAADIEAVPIVAVEREACNCQGLALGAGLLYPVVAPA